MGRLIAERTGGRHQIRVFHSRQLGEEKETIEQTRAGAIDLNRTNVAPIGSFVPAINVLAMPFLFRSVEHLRKVLDGPIGKEILDSFEPYGFVGLAFYDSGARSIYNSVRPIRSIADIRGLRLRVQQSELMSSMIKALGAEPIELPYGQVSTGLATKLIDGAENNWPSFVTTGHYKYAGYYTLTEHTMSPGSAGDVAQGLGKPLGRRPATSSARRRSNPAASCATNGRISKRNRAAQAEPAGVIDHDGFRSQAFRRRDGGNLRDRAARPRDGRPDRTNPQSRVTWCPE